MDEEIKRQKRFIRFKNSYLLQVCEVDSCFPVFAMTHVLLLQCSTQKPVQMLLEGNVCVCVCGGGGGAHVRVRFFMGGSLKGGSTQNVFRHSIH